jgi:hypothetical protein
MAKSKNRWDVFYFRVDARTNQSVECIAAENVDWRTALVVKRNNKFAKIEIRPTLFAPDNAIAPCLPSQNSVISVGPAGFMASPRCR